MPPAAHRRAADPLVALADQCVQCGLCLPACPTYRLDRLEPESPRGRIALARAWALDAQPPTAAGDDHLDHCLGCRSCEAVCPADVRYGALLVEARARQRQRRGATLRQRAIEWLAMHPAALASALALYRSAWPLLPPRLRPLPRPPAGSAARPASAPARTALFVGCVAGPYEATLREALARVCAALGVGLALPTGQRCCGTLHAHAGDTAAAGRLAGANRQAFAGADTVLTLASGCHEAVAAALAPGASTIDALAFVAGHADALSFAATSERVALHLPCTQRNVVGSAEATRALLARVPGLEVVELDAGPEPADPLQRGMGCCGAAGTAMLADPGRAARFRAPLLARAEAAGVSRLLSANIGCRLHFANASRLPVQHPLEFLAGRLQAPASANPPSGNAP